MMCMFQNGNEKKKRFATWIEQMINYLKLERLKKNPPKKKKIEEKKWTLECSVKIVRNCKEWKLVWIVVIVEN
jgi:hypothetical protein